MRKTIGISALGACLGPLWAGIAPAQDYSFSPEMERKIASHPHVRRLTDWGSRADWSADSKRVIYVSKEYGDVFELEVATGRTRPMTFHFQHAGIFRALYLQNGDLLLSAPKGHDLAASGYGRFFESELWVMKADLSGPPIPLGVTNHEGVAAARSGMRIVWVDSAGPRPTKRPDGEFFGNPVDFMNMKDQIWSGSIVYKDGVPQVTDKRKLLDCAAAEGGLTELNSRRGSRCTMIEPQNLVPMDEMRLTFTMVTRKARADGLAGVASYVLDLRSGAVTPLSNDPGYMEVEGIFPDGVSSIVEHAGGQPSRWRHQQGRPVEDPPRR
jgi:hypothetical protein